MKNSLLTILANLVICLTCFSQQAKTIKNNSMLTDSISISIRPELDSVSKMHRFLFGENYRKEWATPVKMPVIKLSEFNGGLKAVEIGGGNQTQSLRLVDAQGMEWMLRKMEKSPERLLPETIRETFAADWFKDAMSAQHPYAALIVPMLATQIGVAHAKPVIGYIVTDPVLENYASIFANSVCLLEEREPAGETVNTGKMIDALVNNNANTVDFKNFLKARMLDLLISDWDRHGDQWRWVKQKQNDGNHYTAVPRDRDQSLYVNEGLIPYLVSRSWLAPNLQGFGAKVNDVRYSLWKTMFLNRFAAAQISREDWNRLVNEFVGAMTDQVLAQALKQLPTEVQFRNQELLQKMIERRNSIPQEMERFYRFEHELIDIHLSDKNEFVQITDAPNKGLRLHVQRIKQGELRDTLIDMIYEPAITKEIRLYLSAGDDHVAISNKFSTIKLRIIDSLGKKTFNIADVNRKTHLYNLGKDIMMSGNTTVLRKHLSADSANISYAPTNLYHVLMPLASIEINPDEGFLLGLGFKYTRQGGFRTKPYKHEQQLLISHSFSTAAFRVKYRGEWKNAVKHASLVLTADANSPARMNYFGSGNDSELDKTGDFRLYYRTRFQYYKAEQLLAHEFDGKLTLKFGTSFQYYHLQPTKNEGRVLESAQLFNPDEHATLVENKFHGGLTLQLSNDNRNNKILPSNGDYLNLKIQGYKGLNANADDYLQATASFTLFKPIINRHLFFSNRIGAGASFGKPAFYQSLFLGGQENLLGYLQYRFAGRNLVYNNAELRLKLTNVTNYIIPGELGLLAFLDMGRVWEKNERSHQIHYGKGGGIYFVPGGYTSFRLIASHSPEGWYPFFATNFRF